MPSITKEQRTKYHKGLFDLINFSKEYLERRLLEHDKFLFQPGQCSTLNNWVMSSIFSCFHGKKWIKKKLKTSFLIFMNFVQIWSPLPFFSYRLPNYKLNGFLELWWALSVELYSLWASTGKGQLKKLKKIVWKILFGLLWFTWYYVC